MTLSVDIKRKVFVLSLVFSLLLPTLTLAQGRAPGTPSEPTGPTQGTQTTREKPAENKSIIYICTRGAPGECNFQDVILAIQKLLKWARNLALFFSVIVIVVAGFKLMISGDNSSARDEAKKMITKVAIGIFFVMAAWLIVTLITNALLAPGVSTIIQDNKP